MEQISKSYLLGCSVMAIENPPQCREFPRSDLFLVHRVGDMVRDRRRIQILAGAKHKWKQQCPGAESFTDW
jgi:hypothetical protein